MFLCRQDVVPKGGFRLGVVLAIPWAQHRLLSFSPPYRHLHLLLHTPTLPVSRPALHSPSPSSRTSATASVGPRNIMNLKIFETRNQFESSYHQLLPPPLPPPPI